MLGLNLFFLPAFWGGTDCFEKTALKGPMGGGGAWPACLRRGGQDGGKKKTKGSSFNSSNCLFFFLCFVFRGCGGKRVMRFCFFSGPVEKEGPPNSPSKIKTGKKTKQKKKKGNWFGGGQAGVLWEKKKKGLWGGELGGGEKAGGDLEGGKVCQKFRPPKKTGALHPPKKVPRRWKGLTRLEPKKKKKKKILGAPGKSIPVSVLAFGWGQFHSKKNGGRATPKKTPPGGRLLVSRKKTGFWRKVVCK